MRDQLYIDIDRAFPEDCFKIYKDRSETEIMEALSD